MMEIPTDNAVIIFLVDYDMVGTRSNLLNGINPFGASIMLVHYNPGIKTL